MSTQGQTKRFKKVYSKDNPRNNRIAFKCTTHEKSIIHALSTKYKTSIIGLIYTAYPQELQELSEVVRKA
jgi:hypothetical protein